MAAIALRDTWWSRGHEYAWAARFAGPQHCVLDAACGISHPFKLFLAATCREAHACDLDPRLVDDIAIFEEIRVDLGAAAAAEARTSGLLARLRRTQANIARLPYPNAQFDRVFVISVLEHMPAGERAMALGEASRVLRSGGLAVVTFDVPSMSPEAFFGELVRSALPLQPGGAIDVAMPPDALTASPGGPAPDCAGLRCFRVLLRKR